MKEVSQWWEEIDGAPAEWVVFGKGPTFARRDEFDLGRYRTLTLNHAIRAVRADVASVVDIDVVGHCAAAIESNARFLLMPRFPYAGAWVRTRPLEDFFEEYPVLSRLSAEGRLVWYNLGPSPSVPGSPPVPAALFSGAVVIHLLGMLGARRVRTLGVDGGRSYAPSFADLVGTTLLSNGAPDFGVQFEQIAASVWEFGLDFAPLVGDTPAWRAAMWVSLLRHRAKGGLRPVRDLLRAVAPGPPTPRGERIPARTTRRSGSGTPPTAG